MTKAIVDKKLVTVVEVKGGWTTYVDVNGATRKARNSAVSSNPADVAALEALAEAGDTTAQDALIAASNKNHPIDFDRTLTCPECGVEHLTQESLDQCLEEHRTPRRSSMVQLVLKGEKRNAEILERRGEERETRKIAERSKKVRITRANLLSIKCCPECGSEDIFFGNNPEGMVENEDTVAGCHNCDWGVDFSDHEAKVRPDMDRYKVGLGVTARGRATVDIDDVVASTLRGLDLEDVYRYVSAMLEKLGVEHIGSGKNKTLCGLADLHARYDHLNTGMQRMNLGNVLRGTMRRLQMESLPKIEY